MSRGANCQGHPLARPRTALDAARNALLPSPTDPHAFDRRARVESFERHVYLRGWMNGCQWGAAIVGIAVFIGLALMAWGAS